MSGFGFMTQLDSTIDWLNNRKLVRELNAVVLQGAGAERERVLTKRLFLFHF